MPFFVTKPNVIWGRISQIPCHNILLCCRWFQCQLSAALQQQTLPSILRGMHCLLEMAALERITGCVVQPYLKGGKKNKGGRFRSFHRLRVAVLYRRWKTSPDKHFSKAFSLSGKSYIFLLALGIAQAVAITTSSLSALKRLWIFLAVSRKCLCPALVPPWARHVLLYTKYCCCCCGPKCWWRVWISATQVLSNVQPWGAQCNLHYYIFWNCFVFQAC